MEKKNITINGKEYAIPTINFKAVCELENLGLDFTNVQSRSFNFTCALVAYTIGGDLEKAVNEIDAHIKNGGGLEDFVPLFEAVSKSDFFQNLTKKRKK